MDKLVPSAGKTGIAGRRPRGKQSFLQRLFLRFISWFQLHTHRMQPLKEGSVVNEPHKRTLNESFVVSLIERVGRMQEKVLFLTSVFDSTSDAVIVADLKGTVIMYNRGAEEIIELDTDVALGDNIWRLLDDCLPKESEHVDGAKIKTMLIEDERIRNQRVQFQGFKGHATPALLTVNFIEDVERKRIGIVAIIKNNSEVESLTRTDGLTELCNRRHFDECLKREYTRLHREYAEALSLLFVDADNFHMFNEEYGHPIGDEALKQIAQVLRTSCRDIDIAARYGGEEFCLILPNTNENEALIVAERIRQRVAAMRIKTLRDRYESITVSIGTRTHRLGDGDIAKLKSEADKALYGAKHLGRNRVCQYEKLGDDLVKMVEEQLSKADTDS